MTQRTTEPQSLRIHWKKVGSYEEAKDFHSAVYIHDWQDAPYYIGKLGETVFGGSPRSIRGSLKYPDNSNPRYGSSYSHWIDGCLEHGANLYIGTFPDFSEAADLGDNERKEILRLLIGVVEKILQVQLQPIKGNVPSISIPDLLRLQHTGEIPPYL